MIKIKTLKFSNMFSYGEDIEVVFDSRVTQLVGKNGSGKSSIPAVLEDLFYNKTSKGVKKKSIKNRNIDTNYYSSESEFSIDDKVYSIKKRVTSSTKLILLEDGKDISGHTTTQTYEKVQNLLGMDFNTFTKLVYQSMLSNLDFLIATDANRKKFLISLLGLERYSGIADKVKKALSDIKLQVSNHKSSITSLKNYTTGEVPKLKELVKVPDETRLDALRKELDDLNEQRASIARLNDKILANTKSINRLNAIVLPEEPSEPKFDYSVEDKKSTLEKNLAIAESELRTLKKPDTKCPTCGTPYNNEDHVEHIEKRKSELTADIVQIKQNLETVKVDFNKYKTYKTDLAEYEKIKELRYSLEEAIDRSLPTELKEDVPVDGLKTSITKLHNEILDAKTHNIEVDKHNAKVEAEIAQRDKILNDIKIKEAECLVLENKQAKLEILNDAFGTKGLISYKIESCTKVFETLINEYLSIFSDGRFNLVFQVEDTKLALKLYDNGEEIEINSLSSGEFNKVNTSTLLAIRKMMVAVSKVNINILFLDEVISVLDKESKDTLIEVLLNEKELNSLVVSHEYNHPLAKTIKITKDSEGFSSVE